MANPATKNGHIKIANELIEHLATVNIPGQEMRIIWVLWRKTWGWQNGERRKDWDWISITQFEKMTGMKKSNVYLSLKSLLAKRLILKQENLLKFNQNYNEWLLVKRLPLLVKSILPISQKTNKTGSQKTNNKSNKATIQKQSNFFESEEFKQAYNGFKEMRRKKRNPLVGRAELLIWRKLNKVELEEAISMLDEATEKGWSSVFPRKSNETQEQKMLRLLVKYKPQPDTPEWNKRMYWNGHNLLTLYAQLNDYADEPDNLVPEVIKMVYNKELENHLKNNPL